MCLSARGTTHNGWIAFLSEISMNMSIIKIIFKAKTTKNANTWDFACVDIGSSVSPSFYQSNKVLELQFSCLPKIAPSHCSSSFAVFTECAWARGAFECVFIYNNNVCLFCVWSWMYVPFFLLPFHHPIQLLSVVFFFLLFMVNKQKVILRWRIQIQTLRSQGKLGNLMSRVWAFFVLSDKTHSLSFMLCLKMVADHIFVWHRKLEQQQNYIHNLNLMTLWPFFVLTFCRLLLRFEDMFARSLSLSRFFSLCSSFICACTFEVNTIKQFYLSHCVFVQFRINKKIKVEQMNELNGIRLDAFK